MAQRRVPDVDEIRHQDSALVDTLRGINSNTVHKYFAGSPFCDPTSNNAAVISQLEWDPTLQHIIFHKEEFEQQLKARSGIEYLIVNESYAADGTGMWTIRKHHRRKIAGSEDEVTILGIYYVIGEFIYQSVSVESIIGNKLLNISTSLNKLFSTAGSLPYFTPAQGYSYLPPKPKVSETAGLQSASHTRPGTPMAESQSQSQPVQSKENPTTKTSAALDDIRLLDRSLGLAITYPDEYMDENPTQGEPGNFVVSFTNEQLQRQAKAQQQAAKSQEAIASANPSAAPTPPAELKTTGLALRKGSKGMEKSPSSATGPPKPKRRKSKAPGSPVVTSPA